MPAVRSEIMERMRTAFRAEALDLLPELDAALLAMEMEPHNSALVNRVFRAMHTIKGSGATAGFTHLAHFAHGVEEAFDLARANKLAITSELIDCGLKACDVIREILTMEDDDRVAHGEYAVTEALANLLPAAGSASPLKALEQPAAANRLAAYRIHFRPHAGLFRNGTDPLSLLNELRDLGSARVSAHVDGLPAFDTFDPESCYLSWEILLLCECSEEAIREVFLFVEDDCTLTIDLLPHQQDTIAFLLLPLQERAASLHRALHHALDTVSPAMQLLPLNSTPIDPWPQTLQSLAIAASCEQLPELSEAALRQARILGRISRVGRPIGQQDRRRLSANLQTLRLALEVEVLSCV